MERIRTPETVHRTPEIAPSVFQKGPIRASAFYGTDGMHPVPVLGEIHFENRVTSAAAILAATFNCPLPLVTNNK
jgi:hypothetical protein